MTSRLLEKLESRGYRGRVVSITRLHDLADGIEKPHREGLLDDAFYGARLAEYKFEPPDALPGARAMIVVAVRNPHVRFTFTWRGARQQVMVPPTYLRWQETDGKVMRCLDAILGPHGKRVVPAVVPKKLLAVRSGLARYGKNNITYVPGMGSYHRLAAFHSDVVCEADDWQQPKMLESCESCPACLRGCPTGAITADRFLLRAERCIVFHNEEPSHIPFPRWTHASWHNCLVGCLLCQNVCPENSNVPTWVEDGAQFSERETQLLLDGVQLDDLPAATARKLREWDLVDLLDSIPRNLRAVLEQVK